MRKIVVASRSCPHCRDLLGRIRHEILSGMAKVFFIEDGGDADKIVQAFEIDAVPAVLWVADEKSKLLCMKDEDTGIIGGCRKVDVDL